MFFKKNPHIQYISNILRDDAGFNTIPVIQSSLAKPPSRSRPFDPPSRINFENNNLASLTLLFHLFSTLRVSLIFSFFSLSTSEFGIWWCFGFSSPLFFHSVMVLTSDEIREILLRLFASRILVPSSLLSTKREKERKREKRMKERSIKKEKGRDAKF